MTQTELHAKTGGENRMFSLELGESADLGRIYATEDGVVASLILCMIHRR
jgi:hypothetical protein